MQDHKINLLVIEDEEFDVRRITNTIIPFNKNINISQVVSNGQDALNFLADKKHKCDVIIMDFQIAGGLYGEKLIKAIRKIDSTLQVIVITKRTINQSDLYFANQLLDSGAYWYGTKYPSDIEEYIYQPTDFILSIMNAYEKRRLEIEKNRSQSKLDRNIRSILEKRPLLGQAESMLELHKQIAQYAQSGASVMITGQSGTGKELVAMNIHYNSPRKYENFITVNCAAIPKDLIESELFGFVKGSFTGANQEKAGLFELANNGTIFLDEVSELPLQAQAKLLRVLENGEVDKIGRKKRYQVDIRVISATNSDLEKMMQAKQFREDLYYRLNILQIRTPALIDHQEDVPLIVEHFIKYYSVDLGRIPPKLSPESTDILNRYHWPGNIRQLKNIIQRLVLTSEQEITAIKVRNTLGLVEKSAQTTAAQVMSANDKIKPLKEVETNFRRDYFKYVRQNSKTDADAAYKLGLAPPNFHRMCRELGLK